MRWIVMCERQAFVFTFEFDKILDQTISTCTGLMHRPAREKHKSNLSSLRGQGARDIGGLCCDAHLRGTCE